MSKRSAELAHLYLSLEPIPLSSEPGASEPPYGAGTTWQERYGWMESYTKLETNRLFSTSLPENNATLFGLLELMKNGERCGVRIDLIDVYSGDVLEQVLGLIGQTQLHYFIQDIHDDPNASWEGLEDSLREKNYLVSRHLAVVFDGAETIEEKYQEVTKIALQALATLQFDFASWIPF